MTERSQPGQPNHSSPVVEALTQELHMRTSQVIDLRMKLLMAEARIADLEAKAAEQEEQD